MRLAKDKRLTMKFQILRCLECSIWEMFFSWSLTVSIKERLRKRILSINLTNCCFIFFLRLLTAHRPKGIAEQSTFLWLSKMELLLVGFQAFRLIDDDAVRQICPNLGIPQPISIQPSVGTYYY